MIAINNVDPNLRPLGEHEYELRINKQLIARFTHMREEGLTRCLERAAVAAEKAKWEEVQKPIDLAVGREKKE